MKKLMLLAVLSVFSFSAAAHACDGVKGHTKAGDSQAAKGDKKDTSKPKKDSPPSDGVKS
jgi:hypothetical protein